MSHVTSLMELSSFHTYCCDTTSALLFFLDFVVVKDSLSERQKKWLKNGNCCFIFESHRLMKQCKLVIACSVKCAQSMLK